MLGDPLLTKHWRNTMNAYETAQSLGITGTDAEIVAALQAITLHVRDAYITGGPADTPSKNILHLLTARHRVMGMNALQQWSGPLIIAEEGNAGVKIIMDILRTQLQVNDTKALCSVDLEAAQMVNSLTTVVGALTGKLAQVIAEVALLTGGRIGAQFADLTTEQFTAQRTDAEALSLKQTALTRCTEAMEAAQTEYRSADSTPATIVQAMLDSLGAV